MDLRHLRYFLAVAEELSFTAAAKRLNLSQPPLSQQIRDLEAELETPLFERSSRRVELTAAGRGLVDHARAILAQAEQAVEDVRVIGAGRTGMIRVGTTGTVLLGPLAGLMAGFAARHPGIAVRVREMGPVAQVEALKARRVDVIFLRRPPVEPELAAEVAWRERVGVALPVRHPLAARPRLLLRALEGEDMVSLRLRNSRFAQYLRDCCVVAGFAPRIVHEVVEAYSQASLVAAGLGVALVPECVRLLARTDIVWRPLEPPVPEADVWMLTRLDRPAAVDRLLEVARELLPERLV